MNQKVDLPTLATNQQAAKPEPISQDDQSQNQNPSDAKAPNFSSDAPPDLNVPDFDAPLPGEMGGGPALPEFIGPEVFFEMHFKGSFSVSNIGFAMATKSEPLQSLAAAPGMEGAREASDAIYEIVKETASLHFLIKPQSIWFQRLTVIGGFGVAVGMSVAAEIEYRREDAATRPDPEPAAMPQPDPVPDETQEGTVDLRKSEGEAA